jgi:hypothetical protein
VFGKVLGTPLIQAHFTEPFEKHSLVVLTGKTRLPDTALPVMTGEFREIATATDLGSRPSEATTTFSVFFKSRWWRGRNYSFGPKRRTRVFYARVFLFFVSHPHYCIMRKIIDEIVRECSYIYHQYLYVPSNRKRLLRHLIVAVLLFSSWLWGYKFRDAKILLLKAQIEELTERKAELKDNIAVMEEQLKEYNFIINDKHYYRYQIFRQSELMVPASVPTEDLKLMLEQVKKYKIPAKYYFRLIMKESRYNPSAVSHKGARGYMQVMPATFEMMKNRYGKDISKYNKQQQNILIGSYTIHYLHKKYNNWRLTFAAYNAGSGRVDECKCVPNFTETQGYVKYIMDN